MKLFYAFDYDTGLCQALTWAYDDSFKELNQYCEELIDTSKYDEYAKNVGKVRQSDGTWVENPIKPIPIPEPPMNEQIKMQKLNDIEIAQLEESLKAESERKAIVQKQYDLELMILEISMGV